MNTINGMAQRIKEQRKKFGFTQEEMAERVDLSASSYTKIENDFQSPSLNTLIKLSIELNLSLDYLVFGQEQNQKELKLNEALTSVVRTADVDKLSHANDMLSKIIKALKSSI